MIEKINNQLEQELVCIEDLVLKDHILRKIDKHIDFNFIYEKVSHLYCHDNGRPSIDPVRLFKMILLGYLFGIKSERRLVKEIHHNVAYRWFLGYNLTDKIPHHSVFSQNRKRRFIDSSIFQEIFEHIVFLAMKSGLIGGKVLYTDSTHIKANANKKKFRNVEVEKTPQEYIDELDQDVDKDRVNHGKKPFPKKERNQETKVIKQSTTDPDSGNMNRDNKPKGHYYLDHRTVDSDYNFITDVYITPGNVNDSTCYIDRLKYQVGKFGFNVEAVGLDAGYNTAYICKTLCELDILGTIGRKRPGGKKHFFKKSKFQYDSEQDIYICPNNCILRYCTTKRDGHAEYKSLKSDCQTCPYFDKCITSSTGRKTIYKHVWDKYKEKIKENTKSDLGKEIYRRRKETVERSFANSKELHGYRYAKFRGLENVKFQAYMTAIAQNLKKMAMIFSRMKTGDKFKLFAKIFRLFLSDIYNYELEISKIRIAT